MPEAEQALSENMAAYVEGTSQEVILAGGHEDLLKPALGLKPRLTPKPFSLQRNTTIRSILAPKSVKTAPRPEVDAALPSTTNATELDAAPELNLKKESEISEAGTLPFSSTDKPEATGVLNSSSGTPVLKESTPALKPATPIDLQITKSTKEQPGSLTESQTPASSESSSSPVLPDVNLEVDPTNHLNQKELGRTQSQAETQANTNMSTAASQKVMSKEEEEESATSPALTPMSQESDSSASSMETPVANPTPQWGRRNRLSMKLTSKFESGMLSTATENSPAQEGKKDSCVKEGEVRPGQLVTSDPAGSPISSAPRKRAEEEGGGEIVEKEVGLEETTGGNSIKRRISLLFDSSSRPEVPTRRKEPGALCQPNGVGDVKQRIKVWASEAAPPTRMLENTPPSIQSLRKPQFETADSFPEENSGKEGSAKIHDAENSSEKIVGSSTGVSQLLKQFERSEDLPKDVRADDKPLEMTAEKSIERDSQNSKSIETVPDLPLKSIIAQPNFDKRPALRRSVRFASEVQEFSSPPGSPGPESDVESDDLSGSDNPEDGEDKGSKLKPIQEIGGLQTRQEDHNELKNSAREKKIKKQAEKEESIREDDIKREDQEKIKKQEEDGKMEDEKQMKFEKEKLETLKESIQQDREDEQERVRSIEMGKQREKELERQREEERERVRQQEEMFRETERLREIEKQKELKLKEEVEKRLKEEHREKLMEIENQRKRELEEMEIQRKHELEEMENQRKRELEEMEIQRKHELEEMENKRKRELEEMEIQRKHELKEMENQRKRELEEMENKRKHELEEMENQRKRELEEMENQRKRELQEEMENKRKRELEEMENKRKRELEEMENQRKRELEEEMENQRKRELEKEMENQRKLELEEMENKKKRELEEMENQRKRELEKEMENQRKRELEKEMENQRKLELEEMENKRKRELEEMENKRKRELEEMEMENQRKRELEEMENKRKCELEEMENKRKRELEEEMETQRKRELEEEIEREQQRKEKGFIKKQEEMERLGVREKELVCLEMDHPKSKEDTNSEPPIEVVYDDFSVSRPVVEVIYEDFSVKPRRWGSKAKVPLTNSHIDLSSTGVRILEPDAEKTSQPARLDTAPTGDHVDKDIQRFGVTDQEENSDPLEQVELVVSPGGTEWEEKIIDMVDNHVKEEEGKVIYMDENQVKEEADEQKEQVTSSTEEGDAEVLFGADADQQNEGCDSTSALDGSPSPQPILDEGPLVPPQDTDPDRPLFPETTAPLLDNRAQKSKAQLGKRRSVRTRPPRLVNQSPSLTSPTKGPTQDWRACDSAGNVVSPTSGDTQREKEQPRGKETSQTTPTSHRVALFAGLDPSVLMAQLKRRGKGTDDRGDDKDGVAEVAAPAPSQLAQSPRSPFLPGATRVLPPIGSKAGDGTDSSPSWLQELKSKKRLSQYDSET